MAITNEELRAELEKAHFICSELPVMQKRIAELEPRAEAAFVLEHDLELAQGRIAELEARIETTRVRLTPDAVLWIETQVKTRQSFMILQGRVAELEQQRDSFEGSCFDLAKKLTSADDRIADLNQSLTK